MKQDITIMVDTRQHFPPNNEAHQPDLRDVRKFSAMVARSLSENREPTVEKPFWSIFTLIFVK